MEGQDTRGLYQSILSMTRVVGEMTGSWQLLPPRRQRQISWRLCWDGRLPNRYLQIWNNCYNGYWGGGGGRHRRLPHQPRLGSLLAKLCCIICFRRARFRLRGHSRASGLGYGSVFLVWQTRPWCDQVSDGRSRILLRRDPHRPKSGQNEILVGKLWQEKIDRRQIGTPPTQAQTTDRC